MVRQSPGKVGDRPDREAFHVTHGSRRAAENILRRTRRAAENILRLLRLIKFPWYDEENDMRVFRSLSWVMKSEVFCNCSRWNTSLFSSRAENENVRWVRKEIDNNRSPEIRSEDKSADTQSTVPLDANLIALIGGGRRSGPAVSNLLKLARPHCLFYTPTA